MDMNTIMRFVLIIVASLVLVALITYYNKTKSNNGNSTGASDTPPPGVFGSSSTEKFSLPDPALANNTGVVKSAVPVPAPIEAASNEQYRPVDHKYAKGNKVVKDCFPKDRLTIKDLLPKDAANTKWAQVNPAGQGDVRDQNFLTAGFHIGVNTQGQSLRNANLQIRSEPPNPQYQVSPWMQSTIEPDVNRRALELGTC